MHIHAPRPLDFDEAPEQEPDDPEFASLTADSEDGLIAPLIPDDPEHDRMVDPQD